MGLISPVNLTKLYRWIPVLWTGAIIFISCDPSTGLEPVTGVEGRVIVADDWPDDIHGIVVAAFTEIDLENPIQFLVDFSGVLEPSQDTLSYFIQLYPGSFVLAPVGILIDPAFLIANLDSITASDSIPLLPLVNPDPAHLFDTIRSIGLSEGSVKSVPDIVLEFQP